MNGVSWLEILRQYSLPACTRLYVFQDEDVILCSNVPAPPVPARQLGTVITDAEGRVVQFAAA